MSAGGGLRDLRISRKIALAFAAMVVVAVASGAVIFWSASVIGNAISATERASVAEAHALTVVTLMRGQASAIRGLLNTGDRRYIDVLAAERDRLVTLLAEARAAETDTGQLQLLDTIAARAEQWYAGVASEQVRLMGHPDTVTQARAIEFSGASERMLGEIAELSEQVRAAESATAAAQKAAQSSALLLMRIAIGCAVLLSVLFAIGFGLLLVRAIARPVVQMTEVMAELADGNHAVDIPAAERGDELGAMARAVRVFKDNAIERERLAAQEAEAIAAREARARRLEELTGGFDRQVRQSLDVLAAASTELRATAETLVGTADRSESKAAAVAAASEESSGSVQTVAAATEELASSIEEIGRQMAQSTDATGRAVRSAEETGETVRRLADGARRIGDVLTLISEIAAQTNLLALNATIEAARAGDAGKGFAVVASEVKQLASQTAKATEQIAQQIGAIQSDTGGAVSAIERIRAVIGEVDEIATAIASAITEQKAATDEISRNVQQAAQGSLDVSENIAGVKDEVAQTLEAAGQVRGASGDLSQNSEALRAEVERFLAEVRAA